MSAPMFEWIDAFLIYTGGDDFLITGYYSGLEILVILDYSLEYGF
jgi:hypothetical protein